MSQLIKQSLKPNSKVAVIGAGISGLSFTYFLSRLRPDLRFKIYEKSDRHGGYINTVIDEQSGLKYEKGPRTLRGVSDGTLVMLDILLKAGFKDEVYAVYKKSAGNEKYLLSLLKNSEDDYLVKVPSDSASLLKFLMSPLSKNLIKGIIREPFRELKKSDEDESIASFIKRRFDKKVDENLASAMVHGIYGGDTNKLSLKTLMPSLYEVEKESSLVKYAWKSLTKPKPKPTEEDTPILEQISEDLSRYQDLFGKPLIPFANFKKFLKNFPMIVFKNKGLSLITDHLESELRKNPQVEMVYGVEDLKIEVTDTGIRLNDSEDFDHVRSTVSALELAKMVPDPASNFRSLLNDLGFVDMIVVNAFVPNTRLFKEGFGYLVPQSVSPQKHFLLGCIFDSSIEKNSVQLLADNRHLVKLINYELDQDEINSMIKLKDTKEPEKYVKITLMFGGHYVDRYPEIWTQSNRHFKRVINDLISEQFHLDAEEMVVTKIKDCIPQYNVGYLDYKEKVLESLREEFGTKLSLGGMSFNSDNKIGVPDVLMDSLRQSMDFK